MAENPTEPRPPRRVLRLSVRALMLAVLVMALVLGWFVRLAQVQREAVAAIEKAGGRVRYHWEVLPNGTLNPNGASAWPKWVVDRLGVDYFGDVVEVATGSSTTDAAMAALARFDRLRIFNDRRSKVTDSGLAVLRGATCLEEFRLNGGPNLTGASLAHIRGLPRLRLVQFYTIKLADDDLVHLEGMIQLESLDLTSSSVTDRGLAHIRGLTGLNRLGLGFTKVTGAGLSQIRDLARLEILTLESTRVDDDGLAAITKLRSLQTLDLFNTPITDAGLVHLSGLVDLKNLRLSATRITDAGVSRLLGLESLDSLRLDQTNVTDVGLLQLADLRGIRSLDVRGDRGVSGEGVTEFGKRLPAASVRWGALPRTPARPAPKPPVKGS